MFRSVMCTMVYLAMFICETPMNTFECQDWDVHLKAIKYVDNIGRTNGWCKHFSYGYDSCTNITSFILFIQSHNKAYSADAFAIQSLQHG